LGLVVVGGTVVVGAAVVGASVVGAAVVGAAVVGAAVDGVAVVGGPWAARELPIPSQAASASAAASQNATTPGTARMRCAIVSPPTGCIGSLQLYMNRDAPAVSGG
jgi:hypothetical protein